MPSGNSVAAQVLYRLTQITGDVTWQKVLEKQLCYLAGAMDGYPSGHSYGLLTMMDVLYPAKELVCTLSSGSDTERRRKMATAEQDQGSIMTIIATDLPVSDRQLKRIIRRAGVGIARTGAYTGHGSGEVMIGFTTAGRLQGKDSPEIMTREDLINVAFKAAAEAVNEAILNSMTAAGRTGGLAGEVYYSLSEFLPQILKH